MEHSRTRCIYPPSKYTPSKQVEHRCDQKDICRQWVNYKKDPDWLDLKIVDGTIGKGVYTKTNFHKGDFLIEYHGELITEDEGCKRENQYHSSGGSFLFYFKHERKSLCVDATFSNRIGKYINNAIDFEQNSEILKVVVSGNPHLCVFATKNIQRGEEIRCNFGGTHWRIPTSKETPNQTITKKCSVILERLPMTERSQLRLMSDNPLGDSEKEIYFSTKVSSNSIEEEYNVENNIEDVSEINVQAPLNAYEEGTHKDTERRNVHYPSIDNPLHDSESENNTEDLSKIVEPKMIIKHDSTPNYGIDNAEDLIEITVHYITIDSDATPTYEGDTHTNTEQMNIEYPSIDNQSHDSEEEIYFARKICSNPIELEDDVENKAEFAVDYTTLKPVTTTIYEGDTHTNTEQMNIEYPSIDNQSHDSEEEIYFARKICSSPIELVDDVENKAEITLDYTTLKPVTTPIYVENTHTNTEQMNIEYPSIENQSHDSEEEIYFTRKICSNPIELEDDVENKAEIAVDYTTLKPVTTPIYGEKVVDMFEKQEQETKTVQKTTCHQAKSLQESELLKQIESETQSLQSGNNGPQRKVQYKKPYRPCPYCEKLMSKLRAHLEIKHKEELEVKAALLLKGKERNLAFDSIRKKGILKFNMDMMRRGDSVEKFQRERKQDDENNEVTYCSKCYAFVSSALFYRHKNLCYMSNNSTAVPNKIHPSIHLDVDETPLYEKEISTSFQNDEVGSLCRSDPLITKFGRWEFKKVTFNVDKKDEKRKTLKSDMRRLARLYIAFKTACKDAKICTESAMDIFNRANFYILRASISQISSNEDGTSKDGFKVGIGYLLKKVAKYIYGSLLEAKNDRKATEITVFLDLLNFHWTNIFSESEYSIKKARRSILRKPVHLPLQDDVQLLRNFTVTEIKRISDGVNQFISHADYVYLRDLLVCRITLFNARRGGEPSRLKLEEWTDAEEDVWHHHVNKDEFQDPVEKKLFERFKLAYQPGKTGKLVPLLIIDDCWKGMRILVNPEIRIRVGIHKQNQYVFPYTQLSNHHVIGWNAVNKCSSLAGCTKRINATNRRHHVATLYAAHDVPSDERAGFLLHMDHSESINRNIYQSPPAVTEITRVGKFLLRLDDTGDTNNKHSPEHPRPELKSETSNSAKSYGKTLETNEEMNKQDRGVVPKFGYSQEASDDAIINDERRNDETSEGSSTTARIKKKKKYHMWNCTQSAVVRETFKEYICLTDNIESNKGKLPGQGELQMFLQKHPEILKGESEHLKMKTLKTKIFNERKQIRIRLRNASKHEKCQ